MPQSDGKNKLKRMQFEFDGKVYQFNLNPEEYTQDEPSRSTITHTKGGAWIDDFGAGLVTIYMAGTTGMSNGFEKFKELRGLIRNYYNSITPGHTVTKELIFHNFTDEESWVVHPDPSGFRLLRSKSNPLLYRYEIRLVCLRPYQIPASQSKTNTQIGKNPYGSEMVTLSAQAVESNKNLKIQVSEDKPKYEIALPMLASLVGMIDGRPTLDLLTYVRGLKVLASKDVQFQGTISNPKYASEAYPEMKVSALAYENYQNLKSIIAASNVSGYASSDSLLTRIIKLENSYKTQLSDSIKSMLKLIFLEIYGIVNILFDNPEQLSNKLSERDLDRIIENLSWVTSELVELQTVDVDIVFDLRILERALKYVRVSSELFKAKVGIEKKHYNLYNFTKNYRTRYAPTCGYINYDHEINDNTIDVKIVGFLDYANDIKLDPMFKPKMRVYNEDNEIVGDVEMKLNPLDLYYKHYKRTVQRNSEMKRIAGILYEHSQKIEPFNFFGAEISLMSFPIEELLENEMSTLKVASCYVEIYIDEKVLASKYLDLVFEKPKVENIFKVSLENLKDKTKAAIVFNDNVVIPPNIRFIASVINGSKGELITAATMKEPVNLFWEERTKNAFGYTLQTKLTPGTYYLTIDMEKENLERAEIFYGIFYI